MYHLAMAIGFIFNDATRGTFSAFDQGGIDVLFDFIDGNVNDGPLFSV